MTNKNSKFKDQLDVESATTSRYMCTYICINSVKAMSSCIIKVVN